MYDDIFSTINPSLLLIQEGQLSVSGERMCTSTEPKFVLYLHISIGNRPEFHSQSSVL